MVPAFRGTILTLCIVAFSWVFLSLANEEVDIDKLRGDDADMYIRSGLPLWKHKQAVVDFPHNDLAFYRRRDSRLAQTLHDEALYGSGVRLVGKIKHRSPLSLFGRKGMTSTYYLSRITPASGVSEDFGLTRIGQGAPNGKDVWAFWKHKGGRIELLKMDTISHTDAVVEFQRLETLIPVDKVHSIV
ncbi:hypothetical protein PSEUBRA_006143 [Kalmanozyma brasiliensis GHG001]|uniref:uncharacterized protein n=1 Tax=Kalmanozyma brasiliensis (strain GHG001) TaxID=1365824 RepID=UPI001CE888C9|nr:uncharacterized protein PSEUBRA_006143 [Kalmanozyma brasiliensis GHG001]KAF6767624.1 hypothetical protein PSEUBRA_006143 [Kalmanozyma brasiliensis GHG001]